MLLLVTLKRRPTKPRDLLVEAREVGLVCAKATCRHHCSAGASSGDQQHLEIDDFTNCHLNFGSYLSQSCVMDVCAAVSKPDLTVRLIELSPYEAHLDSGSLPFH